MDIFKIHPIVMGTKIFDQGMMTYQHAYGTPYTIPIYCWYLEGGSKTIIVDTGEMNPVISKEREKAIGGKIYNFEDGLKKWGLSPDDIDIVIHTHLHNDHCENDYKCVNAVIYTHEKEIEQIQNPHPLDFRYLEDYIEDVYDNGQIITITKDQEIVPGINVIHTPAHTKGGLSVAVETEKGTAIITGFCTIMENFYPPKEIKAMEMEVIPPGTIVDSYSAYDILIKIKKKADILLPLHEPVFASKETIP